MFSARSKLPVLSYFSESIISQKTNHTTLQWSLVNFTGGQLSSNNCGSVCFCFLLLALLHYTDNQAFPWTIMMTKNTFSLFLSEAKHWQNSGEREWNPFWVMQRSPRECYRRGKQRCSKVGRNNLDLRVNLTHNRPRLGSPCFTDWAIF